MEVGTHSPWVSRLFKERGFEVIVANPASATDRGESAEDRSLRCADAGAAGPTGPSPSGAGTAPRREAQQHRAMSKRAMDWALQNLLINQVRGLTKGWGTAPRSGPCRRRPWATSRSRSRHLAEHNRAAQQRHPGHGQASQGTDREHVSRGSPSAAGVGRGTDHVVVVHPDLGGSQPFRQEPRGGRLSGSVPRAGSSGSSDRSWGSARLATRPCDAIWCKRPLCSGATGSGQRPEALGQGISPGGSNGKKRAGSRSLGSRGAHRLGSRGDLCPLRNADLTVSQPETAEARRAADATPALGRRETKMPSHGDCEMSLGSRPSIRTHPAPEPTTPIKSAEEASQRGSPSTGTARLCTCGQPKAGARTQPGYHGAGPAQGMHTARGWLPTCLATSISHYRYPGGPAP